MGRKKEKVNIIINNTINVRKRYWNCGFNAQKN